MFGFGQWQIEERLFENTTTVVYRARRSGESQSYILKLPRTERPSVKEQNRYQREHETLRQLTLPSVIRTYGLEWHGVLPVLLLEDFGGISMRQWLQGQSLELLPFLRLAVRITEAVGELHKQGILHLDLNPSNIVIHPETRDVKLIDFGRAVRLTEDPFLETDLLEGTLAYISPEQTGRLQRVVDHRSDLYSLGVMFYELLTGVPPFPQRDPLETIHAHIAQHPPSMCEQSPDVPPILSDLIFKCLAKMAEDRYASATGLCADLLRCLQEAEATGTISRFPLAEQDVSETFRIPQTLIGREAESEALLSAFRRVLSDGKSEWVFLTGPGGIGKTALVYDLQREFVSANGLFLAGKCEALKQDIPYAPLLQAFERLVDPLLTESEERMQMWKQVIQDAVCGEGQVLIDFLPELRLLIGPQPPVPVLPAAEAQRRFYKVWVAFLRVFLQAGQPLVLFLDDLQHADPATLQLLRRMAVEFESAPFFVIGAYRDREVGPEHPLCQVVAELQQSGLASATLTLHLLSTQELNQMLAATLQKDSATLLPLAVLLKEKTAGNPFFFRQFLFTLHERKLIHFDAKHGVWRCDSDRVRQLDTADNVAELMTERLQMLPSDAQTILRYAACAGLSFDPIMVAEVLGQSQESVLHALHPAIQQGLVTAKVARQRFESAEEAPYITLRFFHDRVQQAADALNTEAERQAIHLALARWLAEQLRESKHAAKLFEVVNHFAIAVPLLTDFEDKRQVAEWFLSAGQKAKSSSAHEAALHYLQMGCQLLGEAGFAREVPFAFQMHVELGEVEYLCGLYESALERFDALLPKAPNVQSKASVYELKIALLTNQLMHGEVVKSYREALQLLGIAVPRKIGKGVLLRELLTAKWLIGKRTHEELLALPEITDPLLIQALRLINTSVMTMFHVDRDLCLWSTLRCLTISLQYGNCEYSAIGYGSYGKILSLLLRKSEIAYRYAELSCQIADKYGATLTRARVQMAFASSFEHWKHPLQQAIQHLKECVLTELSADDGVYASFMGNLMFLYLLFSGRPLDEAVHELLPFESLAKMHRNPALTSCMKGIRHGLLYWANGTGEYEELSLPEEWFEHNTSFFVLHLFRLTNSMVMGEYETAISAASEAERYADTVEGLYLTVEMAFLQAVAVAEMASRVPRQEQAPYRKQFRRLLRQFQKWLPLHPPNYQHRLVFLQAEEAVLAGRHDLVLERYEEAIRLAGAQGVALHEALACERAARYCLQMQLEKPTKQYLADAYDLYVKWGSVKAARRLRTAYPQWLRSASPMLASGLLDLHGKANTASVIPESSLHSTEMHLVDLFSVLKTAQAISGEIVLPNLIEKMTQILLENAGAQLGTLLFEQDGRFVPHSLESSMISPAVVHYVTHTGKRLVLHDACHEGLFVGDTSIQERQVKSLLCLPIMHQAKLVCLLYLENNLSTHVFTPERVELLQILSTQVAISIENATLYKSLETSRDQLAAALTSLEEYSQKLEEKVQMRTADLEEANKQLERSMRETARAWAEVAVLEERTRIAHEIHDVVGHTLTTAIVQLEASKRLSAKDVPGALQKVENAQEQVRNGLNAIRRSLKMLKEDNATIHLGASLEKLLRETQKNTGLAIEFQIDPLPELDAKLKKILYHALQEGLTNGIRHGQCTAFVFRLHHVQQEPERLLFELQDNGGGCEEIQFGFGLTAMKERIESMGGELRALSGTGEGWTLRLTVPVQPQNISVQLQNVPVQSQSLDEATDHERLSNEPKGVKK